MEEKRCELPEDVVVEVLCRLPKKSLARFKCVCKQWLGLISDRNRVFPKKTHVGLLCQNFIKPLNSLHDHRFSKDIGSPSAMNFLHLDSKGSAYPESFHPLLHNTLIERNYSLEGSCNGFLLFRNRHPSLPHTEEDYVVYHPATQLSWNLPTPPKEATITSIINVGLASDGQNHFKMVRIVGGYYKNIECQVYSSQNGGWWEVSPTLPFAIPTSNIWKPFNSDSVFVGGALHWINVSYLLIYHLDDADCERISLPPVPGPWKHQTHRIWDSEGHLNYCNVSSNSRIRIWSLDKRNLRSDGRMNSFRWKVKHNGILALPFVIDKDANRLWPIAFNNEFAIVYLICSRRVFSYNLATKETKVACTSPFEGSGLNCWRICRPFLFLTQIDIAALVMGNGGRRNLCPDEKVKKRKLL